MKEGGGIGALVVASLLKGEERALAATSSPPAVEPSGGAVGKREEGAPVTTSRPHGTEPSGGAAVKGEEEAADVVKVETPPTAELPGADPAAPTPDPAAAALDLVAAVLDPATTVTGGPP
ncbi:hypothetical protein GUJ93_ZPchr0012g21829 [Zizania palustris]|uniref:Uncharacterized protein n=1 Tax=Zizania palustris TaxID=103762 RepID=A0A8J5WWC1_ZIZPA|nr:hypothetical protein GUJ93_ZPchr0012g21829 [Zizania palustris]